MVERLGQVGRESGMHAVGLYRNSHFPFCSHSPMLYMIAVKIVSLCNCLLRVGSHAHFEHHTIQHKFRYKVAKYVSFIDLTYSTTNIASYTSKMPMQAMRCDATQCDPTTPKLQYHAQVCSALVTYHVRTSSFPSPIVHL